MSGWREDGSTVAAARWCVGHCEGAMVMGYLGMAPWMRLNDRDRARDESGLSKSAYDASGC